MNFGILLDFVNIPCSELKIINEDISKHVHGKLLDIGCGKKQKIFMSKVDKYVGMDWKESLDVNYANGNLKPDVYGDALDLPFRNNSFDCLVALSVFEHLRNPFKASKEAYRVLKKGGTFALTVPFLNRIHLAPYDYFRFTKYGLAEILIEAGFREIKIESYGGMWKVIGARLAGYFYSDVMGLGYGKGDLEVKPKKYLLPFLGPLIFLIVVLTLTLDKIHCVRKDSFHYYAICKK